MQRISAHFWRYVHMLIVVCVLFVRAVNVKARQNDAPSHTNGATIDGDANAGEIFNALRQQLKEPINAHKSDGLRYTITHLESPPLVPTTLSASRPITQAQNDVSTYPDNESELSRLVSAKADDIFRTLQKSRILENILKFLTPNREQNIINQHGLEQRDEPIKELPRSGESNDGPLFSSSIDVHPESVLTSNMRNSVESNAPDWKHMLFGPTGMFTEIFNMINEKRKEDERQRASIAAAAAAAAASAAKTHADSTEPTDLGAEFTKIIESFLSKTQSGNFDEPPPEIPFLGICDRLSCGDIYKAFEEFRKSELFSNFQTAISLLHDQKGWDIIGEMLANPELIDNFTGGGSDATNGNTKTASINNEMSASGNVLESTDGRNIGIDYSKMVDEQPGAAKLFEKSRERPHGFFNKNFPETAENVDYYTSVDKGVMEEKILKPASTLSVIKVQNGNVSTAQKPTKNIIMPEIAESIDEYSDIITDNVDVEETAPQSTIFKSVDHRPIVVNANEKSYISASGSPRVTTMKPLEQRPETIVAKVFGGNGSRIIGEASASTVVRVPSVPLELAIYRGITRQPATRQTFSRTTKRNFRRFNDYYSMYYDGGT